MKERYHGYIFGKLPEKYVRATKLFNHYFAGVWSFNLLPYVVLEIPEVVYAE